MMKKVNLFISLLFSLVLLIACDKGLNGVYEGKNGIVSFHLEIKDKVASLKMNALIVEDNVDLSVDSKNKELTGTYRGDEVSLSYEMKGKTLVLTPKNSGAMKITSDSVELTKNNGASEKELDRETSSTFREKEGSSLDSSTKENRQSSSAVKESGSNATATNVMDVNAIKLGTFSSLVGTWQNANGKVLKFDRHGLVEPQNARLNVSNSTLKNGILKASLQYEFTGAMIYFAPKGAVFPDGVDGKRDASDSFKDRIWTGQQGVFSDADVFYYKISSELLDTTGTTAKPSGEEARKRRNTGVWLSGGQSSVDYANEKLGFKEREVFAGNYGMT
ncbi:DUF6287 domain-containing protein, partial [Streptococcus oralis]|uniref:DUF6287 domain-containing protein n=1 Tax=Streptococcus oralis TaxID=1303 RepID=UPI001F50EA22